MFINNSLNEMDEKPTVGIVGLGYVGLPVAVGFAQKYRVTGFDINNERITSLQAKKDVTGEVTSAELEKANITFTSEEQKLEDCQFIIVTVPTPINKAKVPDLSSIKQASATIGKHLPKGAFVVYESTVYPGVTEDICLPLLEEYSGLQAGKDFEIGYSPERINPGDKEHTFLNIPKVVSAQSDHSLQKIYNMYKSVLNAPVYKAASIKVAEASKIVENTQRDINIALINELFYIFNRMGISIFDVLNASSSKWNFLPFEPGLVGGHCIGVDPYYLIHQSKAYNFEPELISSARKVNDNMPAFLIHCIFKLIIENKMDAENLKLAIFGVTFKENVRDLRNSKALEMVSHIKKSGLDIDVYDPFADVNEAKEKYGITIKSLENKTESDILIVAVPHREFVLMNAKDYRAFLKEKSIIMDLKNILKPGDFPETIRVWKL